MSSSDLTNSTIEIIPNGKEKEEKKANFLATGLQSVHNTIGDFVSKNKKSLAVLKVRTFIAVVCGYFSWATYYFVEYSKETIDSSSCSGYGFLLILFVFFSYGVLYSYFFKPYIFPHLKRIIFVPLKRSLDCIFKVRFVKNILYLALVLLVVGYLIYDTSDNRQRLLPLAGIATFLCFGFLLCKHPEQINWRPIIGGLILQFTFGLITIRWKTGRDILECVGNKVTAFLNYAQQGATFVYGVEIVEKQKVFAFMALSTIYFLAFFINVLYHYGVMQKVVTSIGEFLQMILGTTICESVNSAANIFLGQTEAPLLLAPYLANLTGSEIHTVMVSGFATVSGTVLAAYVSFGAKAEHLIVASVMAAPGALCYSKLLYPETETTAATKESIALTKSEYKSVLDAASKGASQATQLVLGIIANVIAFVAAIYCINGFLDWFGVLVGFTAEAERWSLDRIVGIIFRPISYLMGIPWEDSEKVGTLIGLKTMVNEFVAFEQLGKMTLTPRTKAIATYAICGFANPSSVGIMISALGTLMPNKSHLVTEAAIQAFIGGSMVCFITACFAGLLIPDELIT